MACQAIHLWTFSRLVGAVLDLAIAYLLLCASAIAFFASKFLGIFGLSLPCPCNGLFGNPRGSFCVQKLLVDRPIEKVSNVQNSAKSKFPFDLIWVKDQNCNMNNIDGFVETEADASCSSVPDARKLQKVGERDSVPSIDIGVINSPSVKERWLDLKGKGILNQRPRSGIRRRRKVGIAYGKFSSYDLPQGNKLSAPHSPSSIRKERNETIIEDRSVHVDANSFEYDEKTPIVMTLPERACCSFESNELLDEDKHTEKNVSSFEERKGNSEGEFDFDNDEKNSIKVLEQALEEEHAARAAIYIELEKERSAAASATDEAMAMILRLQEEKASIEMEARQYQRMIEEKSAYDAEEMDILKEILLRREREKHFLEKEVEAYRHTYIGNEHLEGDDQDMDTQRHQLGSSLEDPVLMLHQLSKSIDKKKMFKSKSSGNKGISIDNQNYNLAITEEVIRQGWGEDADFSKQGDLDKHFSHESICSHDGNQELGKEMVSINNNSYGPQSHGQRLETFLQSCKSSSSQEHNFLENGTDKNDHASPCQGMSEESNETEIYISYSGEDAYQERKDPCTSVFNKEPCVHDVHVIADEPDACSGVSGNKNDKLSVDDASRGHRKNDLPLEASMVQSIDVIRDWPSTSRLDSEPEIKRSISDMTSGLPPVGPRAKSLLSDLRRNSLSAVDDERLKLDTEVGWLRERLRIVQEGREKLNLSMEHQEREKMQLQLLEDIARQLQEIRQLTEPRKAVRQASLPPPSSKVISKKRRYRSASFGVHKSS